jgi:hypothetical protein
VFETLGNFLVTHNFSATQFWQILEQTKTKSMAFPEEVGSLMCRLPTISQKSSFICPSQFYYDLASRLGLSMPFALTMQDNIDFCCGESWLDGVPHA